MTNSTPPLKPVDQDSAAQAGLRFGARGTHSSRTTMLREITELFAWTQPDADEVAFAEAVLDENALGKPTIASRRHTLQRLSELYALDQAVPLFRVLRRLWGFGEAGRPLLALLTALARDPLLRASAPPVLELREGSELARQELRDALRSVVGDRLNDSTLDKVVRNCASSWTQSGHLAGRTRKIRHRVEATPAAGALAVWLGSQEGLAGEGLLDTLWMRSLDCSPRRAQELTLRASQAGLINARIGGGVVEIDASRLDPIVEGG